MGVNIFINYLDFIHLYIYLKLNQLEKYVFLLNIIMTLTLNSMDSFVNGCSDGFSAFTTTLWYVFKPFQVLRKDHCYINNDYSLV